MKERAQELKAASRRGPRAQKADGESDVLAKNLDDGAMWPTAFAVKELTADVEATIGALVATAVS